MNTKGPGSRLGVAVIGAGRIGAVHARNLAWRVPGARLLHVIDPVADAARALAEQLGVPDSGRDAARAFEDPAVQAVVIASSTNTHAELTVAAARAGKQVFLEKPVDPSLAGVDRVLAAVREAGVCLQVGFNRRFDPDFARIRAAVASGEIGRLELLRITSRDPEPPPLDYVRVSGGLFQDMCIHDLDMARFITGQEVSELHVMADALVDPAIGEAGDVDTALVSLRFADGALGAIDNSRRAVYGYDQRLEVHGSGAMLQNQNHFPDSVLRADGGGVHGARAEHFFIERYQRSYEVELRAFVAAIEAGREPPVNGEDGRRALVLALAAGRSLATGASVRPDAIG